MGFKHERLFQNLNGLQATPAVKIITKALTEPVTSVPSPTSTANDVSSRLLSTNDHMTTATTGEHGV